jgi:hypothetical protein
LFTTTRSLFLDAANGFDKRFMSVPFCRRAEGARQTTTTIVSRRIDDDVVLLKLYDSTFCTYDEKEKTRTRFRFVSGSASHARRRVGCVAEREPSRRLSRVFFRSRASM